MSQEVVGRSRNSSSVPRRIAIISHHAASLLNFRGPWIEDLCADGHAVWCLAPDYLEEEREGVRALGAVPIDYPLDRTGMNPWRDACSALAMVRRLRAFHPDVAFTFSIKPVIYGTLAAWVARVPRRVAMVEGAGYAFTNADESPSWSKRALRAAVCFLYRLALARAQRVIFLNPDDERLFVGRGLVAVRKAVVLGGIGVDLDAWQPVAPALVPVTFLLVARLLREKGIVEYVGAARYVKSLHPGTRFILLGGVDTNPGGISQPEVQSWVDEGVLEWPGHTTVQPWMVQASVFVLPSYYREGVPRSTQEAMAMGRAVITSDAPGCRETVAEGINGYLVPVRDTDALARAMLRFVDDPGKIISMGAASRRMAEERFNVREVNIRLTEYLFSVCD